MNLDAYIASRDALVVVAPYFKAALAVTAVLFAASAVFPSKAPLRKLAQTGGLVACVAGFALLARFHYVIATTVDIRPPTAPAFEARLYAPLWIESEKLFFWLVLFTIALFVTSRAADRLVPRARSLVAAAFFGLVAALDPFSNPLPTLHGEILAYSRAVSAGDLYSVYQLLGKFVSYYGSAYMWVHPPLLFASYALLTVALPAFAVGLFSPRARVVELERLSHAPMQVAYLLLTLGMLAGYPWALAAWRGTVWWWSPKITVSVTMWLLYTTYFHARLYVGRPRYGRLTMAVGLVAFAALVYTYLTTYLAPGAHAYG